MTARTVFQRGWRWAPAALLVAGAVDGLCRWIAATPPAEAERPTIATVSVTALTAALIALQSTFHMRENIHTDATAFTAFVVLEADDIDDREHLADARTDAVALRRDTVDTLTRIRSERMLSLASIGAGAPPRRGSRRGGGPQVGGAELSLVLDRWSLG